MTNPIDFNRKALLQQVLDQFKLDRDGYHGPSHWARVRVHALEIGQMRGADLLVVELFAFLHDSQRHSEGTDSQHGLRAAEYAASLTRFYVHAFRRFNSNINIFREPMDHTKAF